MTKIRGPNLYVVDSSFGVGITEDALLTRFETFIHNANILDLEGDYEADVILEQARSDEKRLGPLSAFERKLFALTALLEQRLHDIVQEMETTSTEQVTVIMRERKIGFHAATQVYMQEARMPDSQRAEINMCSITHTNLVTLFDWSLRQRYSQWTSFIIVRSKYIAYTHD